MHFGKVIGIIGGGQLGKMMILPANLLGFKVHCFSNESGSPATIFAHKSVIGDYNDELALIEFAKECDFLTIEFESLNTDALKAIEKEFPHIFSPNEYGVFVTQNRFREKKFLLENDIDTPNFAMISSEHQAINFFSKNGKFILKTVENGYDGKGQYVIEKEEDILGSEISFSQGFLIAEKFVPFTLETSTILTRALNGEIVYYPTPINIHKNGILYKSIVKRGGVGWHNKTREIATRIADILNFVGTLAVEFFVLETGEVLVNEIAPRPHNSGHFTLDLCNVSQFENHIRAITGLPLIQPKLIFEGEMLNLIGTDINLALNILDNNSAKLHIYGKKDIRSKRKMGHINFIYDEIST